MRDYIKIICFQMILLSNTAFSLSQTTWKCSSKDADNLRWTSMNRYQKVAFNVALEQCKKQSNQPATCKISSEGCHYFSNGYDTTPMWQCTAVDHGAEGYTSTAYTDRTDAAMGAIAYCKNNSAMPDTCFINTITCININDRMMY